MSSKEDSSKASGSKNKLFTCIECSYSSGHKSHYTRHLLTHTGQKPFVCKMCDKGFSEKGKLVVHIRALHTGERPYKCDRCDYETMNSSNFTKHMVTHTTMERDRRFTCETCDWRGMSNCHLDIHIRKHTGEMPFILSVRRATRNSQVMVS